MKSAKIIQYQTSNYDFRAWAASVLGVTELELLHQRNDLKDYDNVVEQINVCRDQLLNNFEDCKPVFLAFIKSVISPLFQDITAYQMPPSFRCHFSGKGSSAFHRDRDYGVISGRLNVWLPFTKVWGSNSIWIESTDGKGDFTPIELEYGQALIFDGANLCHGTIVNDTNVTRVSMDFRFAPCHSNTSSVA
jgi:hypothetical protein